MVLALENFAVAEVAVVDTGLTGSLAWTVARTIVGLLWSWGDPASAPSYHIQVAGLDFLEFMYY